MRTLARKLRIAWVFGAVGALITLNVSACGPSLEDALTRSLARHSEFEGSVACEEWQLYQVMSLPPETWLEMSLTREQVEYLAGSRQLWLAACVQPATPFDERMLIYDGCFEMRALSCVDGPDSCGVIARARMMSCGCAMPY